MDSNRDRYLQWFTNNDKKRARLALRDASSVMPEIDGCLQNEDLRPKT